ncbi:DUF6349 family protein [Nonomuraea maritima]|uniref:DUF6349 family protein n=1 Tax=Nonomuraea maritima TaxID=683260 RepID=UPI003723C617
MTDYGVINGASELRGAVARQLHYRTLTDPPAGAWAIYITHPGNQLGRAHAELQVADKHLPTVLFQVRRHPHRFRGACLGCAWESSQDFGHVLDAVEAAHDHTHPQWRNLPPAHEPPKDYGRAKMRRWLNDVTAVYPPGWFDSGGPIVTIRRDPANRRPLPGRAPGGGYDLPARDRSPAPLPTGDPSPAPTLINHTHPPRKEAHAHLLAS